jgi:hypothetical protein
MMNLTDDLDLTPVSDESLVERMRLHRNRLLADSDWTQLPDAPVDREAWATYRQTLRNFPATWTPSPTVNFPEAP